MKTILFYSLLFTPLCSAEDNTPHLIYEEDSFVSTELRCPSPDGERELVYRGLRHKEQAEISVVNELVLIDKGHEIPLSGLFCTTRLYRDNIIKQPWSPDGQWLVFPQSRRAYCFYPVAAISYAHFGTDNFNTLAVQQYTYFLKGGRWEPDNTFTFKAGLSGWMAPYRATISAQGVSYRQIGEMVKEEP